MSERKELVRSYISKGMNRDTALGIAEVSKHQYYYTAARKPRGRKPDLQTPCHKSGESIQTVDEQTVVKEIKCIKTTPKIEDYGYRKVWVALMLLGYRINHKKVYRIMNAYQLLNDRHQRPSRQYVKYRKVCPKGPLEVLEMDIKYQ